MAADFKAATALLVGLLKRKIDDCVDTSGKEDRGLLRFWIFSS